jgi:hypothetical protein
MLLYISIDSLIARPGSRQQLWVAYVRVLNRVTWFGVEIWSVRAEIDVVG